MAYALITGQGRSGTNWLLELFDASSKTFCRNEPDRLEGSPLGLLAEDLLVTGHLAAQPGAGVSPDTLGTPQRDLQRLRGLQHGHTNIVP